jgi:N-methylhydantoinase B
MKDLERSEVSLEGVDPVTFTIVRHRLVRVTEEAVAALKRVSGSPITNEAHDLMVALYTRDGELLTGGVGFLHHYVGASQAAKHVLADFHGDIHDGDVFLLNDPYTAAFHPPDVYIITPIFFDEELVAICANFVHVNDIGAIDPGGFSPNATSVYQEGFQTPGLKLVDRGETRRDVLNTMLNMSRDPGMLELDLRSQIAANNVAKERIRALITEYDREIFATVCRELIEQSRKKFRRRLLEIPDGMWEARQYLDSEAEERVYRISLRLEKKGASLTFDFEGTDPQSRRGYNCTYWTTLGAVVAPMFVILCHDMTWNDGIIREVKIRAPEGSLVNARRPAPISISTVATVQIVNCLSTLALSKMVASCEAGRDRATAVWCGHDAPAMVEVVRNNQSLIDVFTDSFGGAGGARSFADGIDLGGVLPNLVSRWGNVERHESHLPLVYLYRRLVPDSGGPGKYRGGLGHEYAVAPVGPDAFDAIHLVTFGRATTFPPSTGLAGGYPGCTVEYLLYRETRLWETGGRFPPALPDLDAKRTERCPWGVHDLRYGDVFYVRMPGSGGYGDPLERDPDRVARDLAQGKITAASAREIYGIAVGRNGDVDSSLRQAILAARLAAGNRRDAFAPPPSGGATRYRLSENLRIVRSGDAEALLECARCSTVLAPLGRDWKRAVARSERPWSTAGAAGDSPEAFCLREFSCPGCGALLDVEVTRRDDPDLASTLSDLAL